MTVKVNLTKNLMKNKNKYIIILNNILHEKEYNENCFVPLFVNIY